MSALPSGGCLRAGKKIEADRLTIRLTCCDFELLLLGSLGDPGRQARLVARGGVAM
jgi:hypothetical protein